MPIPPPAWGGWRQVDPRRSLAAWLASPTGWASRSPKCLSQGKKTASVLCWPLHTDTPTHTPPPNSTTHTYACTNSLMVMITFLIPSLIFIHRLEEEKNRFVSFVCSLSIIWNLLLPSPPTFPPQPVRSQYERCVRFSMFISVNPLCDLLSWLMSEAGVILHREHPMGWDGVPARVSGGFCHSLLLLPGNSKFDCDTTVSEKRIAMHKESSWFWFLRPPVCLGEFENAATPGYLHRQSTVLVRCCFRTVVLSQWAYFNEQIPTPSQVT